MKEICLLSICLNIKTFKISFSLLSDNRNAADSLLLCSAGS